MPLVVEPLCCAQCAWLSTRHCPHLKRRIDEGAIVIRQVFKFEIIAQQLNAEATLEFCGVNKHTHAESRLESRTPASSTIVEVATCRCWRLAAGHPRQQITYTGWPLRNAA